MAQRHVLHSYHFQFLRSFYSLSFSLFFLLTPAILPFVLQCKTGVILFGLSPPAFIISPHLPFSFAFCLANPECYIKESHKAESESGFEQNMKAHALLALLFIYSVHGLQNPLRDLGTLIGQEENNLDPKDELVTNPENVKAPDESLEHTQRDLDNRVFFFLYTKDNPIEGQRLYVGDDDALQKSNFNFSRPTKFVTHGWINTVKDGAVALVRDAYLQHGDYNVVGIDWGAISFTPYEWASSRVVMVSKYCSAFIDFLQQKGLDLSQVTIVGHSLGGQIAGLTARYIEGHVDLVIALDPALPNFQLAGPGSRVARGDARYVEVIHTNAGVFGYSEAIGDIDFYPNGGGLQAGCKTETCSHLRAFKYFAESINSSDFVAVECSSYSKFRNGECKSNRKVSLGGVQPDYSIKGKYYLRTNETPKYAQGDILQ
nr:phospholipase A1 VesT1.02-like [Megalopta genalis]